MARELEDKVIVITGGTKGVGRELVFGLSKRGARVVFGARNSLEAENIVNAVVSDNNEAFYVHTDLCNIADVKKLFEFTKERYGRLDGYISYAGITPFGSITECSEESFDSVFNINFKSTFFCCKYAIDEMRKNGGGSIVITGSPHAWGGAKDRAAYSCSKGALLALMEHIAHNYADEMIRCNYMTLGWTATEGELKLRKEKGMTEEEFYRYALPLIPMRHMGESSDYTDAYAFLMSDASRYMTGTVMQMTGGLFIC